MDLPAVDSGRGCDGGGHRREPSRPEQIDRSVQFTVLLLELTDAPGLRRGHPRLGAVIDVGPLDHVHSDSTPKPI